MKIKRFNQLKILYVAERNPRSQPVPNSYLAVKSSIVKFIQSRPVSSMNGHDVPVVVHSGKSLPSEVAKAFGIFRIGTFTV